MDFTAVGDSKDDDSIKLEIFNFIAGLSEDDKNTKLESKFNVFMADIFSCEVAFIIHENEKDGSFSIRCVGEEVLERKAEFTSNVLHNANSTEPLKARDFDEKNMTYAITSCYNKPILSATSIYVRPGPYKTHLPFFIILFNKYVTLKGSNPTIELRTGRLVRIKTNFSDQDSALLRRLIQTLYPVVMMSIFDGDQCERMRCLIEIAEVIQSDIEIEKWLKAAAKICFKFLCAERVGFYLMEKNEKIINCFIEQKGSRTYPPVIHIKTQDGIVGKVFEKKEPILLNDPPASLIKTEMQVTFVSKFPVKNVCCMPIFIEEEMKGVMEVINGKGCITTEVTDNIQAIATLCGLGLLKACGEMGGHQYKMK